MKGVLRVPRFLLREEITVRDYQGSGARGPVYGDSRIVRASIQATRRYIEDTSPSGAVSNAQVDLILRPEDGPFTVESIVIARGRKMRVIQSLAYPDERRPSHWEVRCSDIAADRAAGGSGSGS